MKKTAKKQPIRHQKPPPPKMTGERLALEFLKLPLSEHLSFHQAMTPYTMFGKMAASADDLASSAPNESLYLIGCKLRRLFKAQGVHPKTIQRLMQAVTGQMNAYREASVAIRYTETNGRLYQSATKRASRRERR